MDSFQQPHSYMRPPPPPPHMTDPHHHQFYQQHQIQPPRQPGHPQGPWFSSQFQYHPSQTPSPPPQWAPPPPPPLHSDQYPPTASYPPPPSNYPAPHSYHHNQIPPPPRSHVPPQFPPHSHIPQPYSQEWHNHNWPPNQGWDYPAHKSEEDWAARARAWADAKAAMESQQSQSQFAPAGKPQEQNHYYDQYQQSVDSRYPDFQNQSHPSSSYQQFAIPDASLQQFQGHPQELASVSSETSYTSDGHLHYGTRDGTTAGDPTVAFQRQGNLPTNQSVHQQEVPSSYSSVTGKETTDQNQQPYTLLPLPSSSSQGQQQHVQPSIQASFGLGSHPADPAISLADQPLDFAPRFNHDSEQKAHSTYVHHDSATSVPGIDPVTGVPSMSSWASPVTPGVAYPPIPPPLASGPQHDPTPPIPGHVAPPFGRFPGPGIPPSGAPFALSTGTTIQPTAAFSADAYGISGVPERPKKASVPNWLREEIKKAVITAPSVEHPKEETKFEVDDDIDKSYMKGDEPDSKSIDSSKSAEEEEDDEDYAEAARTAAINQEIKRVLTEVLMKVTDELFDEIATKVLNEDDLTAEVVQNVISSNHKAPTSLPSASVPKASAKVLVPVRAKESQNEGDSEKSSSSAPGDVLGLGNYASDDDDGDGEIESSGVPTAKDSVPKLGIKKPLENMHDVADNSNSQLKLEENGRSPANMINGLGKTYSVQSKTYNSSAVDHLHDDKLNKELVHMHPSKLASQDRDSELNAYEKGHDRSNGSGSKNLESTKSELPGKVDEEKATDDRPVRQSKTRSDKIDRREKGSSEKDFVKEPQSSKTRADEKANENHRKKDEIHQKKEKADDGNETKERVKEHNGRQGEKAKELEPRKRSSHVDVKDDRKDSERAHKGSTIDDTSRKREHTKDKGEHRSRHKDASNSDRHRTRRSSSVSSRGRASRDRAVMNASDSSEDSDGSKRKRHSRKRELSPSPVRSRKRQVSRSPHSKHSQRRHSPYSSLDTSRGKRSRSRSPVRRQR
ncbi:hypothetical protein L6164_027302 [Bauhinia variegata]|uniref:Uncharacterized protein n=1 Tax=Bauhinia variegata TaxID=167791 RepID=A0ACB9LTM8_BAUVA|nr:hypothetical protein L6164_027302 [Bauhinia variegata]